MTDTLLVLGAAGKTGARWEEAFPDHRTLRYPDVGHFAPEEMGREAIGPVESFLTVPPGQWARLPFRCSKRGS